MNFPKLDTFEAVCEELRKSSRRLPPQNRVLRCADGHCPILIIAIDWLETGEFPETEILRRYIAHGNNGWAGVARTLGINEKVAERVVMAADTPLDENGEWREDPYYAQLAKDMTALREALS